MSGLTPEGRVSLRQWGALGAVVISAALSVGCGTPRPAPARTTPPVPGRQWDYVVRVDSSFHLDISADFAPFTGDLAAAEGAGSFVDQVSFDPENGERVAPRDGDRWKVDCAGGCRVRYRFRLAQAAAEARDVDVAIAAGGAYFAPPSTWLLHPAGGGQGDYRFRVESPAGVRFVTGVRPAPAGAEGVFEAPIASFEESSFAGFGHLSVTALGESGITAVLAPEMKPPPAVLTEWVRRQSGAVDAALGRAGDGRVAVFVVPGTAEGTRGETLGGGGASVFVRLGTGVTEANLYDDWVLSHELIHARFPSVRRRHSWFSEGLASYVEPFARARAGLLDEKKLWADLVAGMPQGLPGPGDGGLDGNGEWGRVYWGGALYFLQADVEIRRRTRGAHSLESALKAVVATGANVETVLPLARVVELADAETGVAVLRELYEAMGLGPGTVNLTELWARLGVIPEADSVRFDDAAPDALMRKLMTAPR